VNLKNETYLSGDLLKLYFLSASDLTSFPIPCKRHMLRENALTKASGAGQGIFHTPVIM